MRFYCPTRIYSGANALDALKQYTAQRVLVVTDQYFSRTGKAKEIGCRIPGAQVEVFDEVTPDPQALLVARGAALCESYRPQVLIALGGGSPMDCAKGIRLASAQPMLLIAVPTTSGSGSEVTSFAILTHEGKKHTVIDAMARPDVAILDDSLLEPLPAGLIADTGMDLLAHCLEAAVARNRSGMTDALAFYGADVAFRNLMLSWQGNHSVRGRLHEAATMAAMAFDNAGLGLCHAMAHMLGGVLHLPHGRLCAILLPAVMTLNAGAAMEQYDRLARVCGLGGATAQMSLRNLTTAIGRLRQRMGMPENLKQAGVRQMPLEEPMIQAVLQDTCCRTNPIPVTTELIRTLWKAVSG